MRFTGKSVLITGGTSGIGLITAREFLREGACVAIAGRGAARGRTAVQSLRQVAPEVRFHRADVTRANEVRALVRAVASDFGGVDVLFNNAGIYLQKPAEATTEREWDRLLAANLTGYFLVAKAVIPEMRRCGGGVIVNNCSVSAHAAIHGEAAYAASKAGSLLLTKVLAIELARDNIRVNSVSPGVIRTPMYDGWLRDQADPRAAEGREVARHPLGRLGTPEDVARAVLYLASDDAAFVTGTDLPVDGGYLAV